MKTTCLLIALLAFIALPAHSQILGIFQQGAQELKEYGQQIAALELLLTRQHRGYQIVESALTNISSITNNEFNLHQNFYTSLATINPAISQSSEVTRCLSLESTILTILSSALQRWRTSPSLTTNDRIYVSQIIATLTNAASLQLTSLNLLLTHDGLTMTDNDRLQQIDAIHHQLTSLLVSSNAFTFSTDILILNRTR